MSLTLTGVDYRHPNGALALQQIDLAAAAGECIALIGPSGAGKTTLLRVLATALSATRGQVALLDQSPGQLSPRALQRLRAQIGFAHQAPPLPPRQRVVTAVLAGRLGQWSCWQGLASLLWPRDPAGAAAALACFGLEERLYARCDRLSGGQLQRVALARLLYQQPALMLADEPVSALDPTLARAALETLTSAARARGATLVASLHAVDLALACFPRIIGLRAGRVLFDCRAEQVDAHRLAALYAAASPSSGAEAGGPDNPGKPCAALLAEAPPLTALPLHCR